MGLRWLITGGCGFIGRNLIKSLTNKGDHYIRIVDNLSAGTQDDLSKVCKFNEISPLDFNPNREAYNVNLIAGDILDSDLSVKVAKGIDIIVHLAANTGVGPSVENPRNDCDVNVIGTLNYLEAARFNNVKRFIFASSGAPVGECNPPIHEEVFPHPVSPYGASKLAGEGYCSAYFRTYGIETVALRFGNAYGPLSLRKESIVAKVINNALKNETIKIYGDGNQTRDYIFVDDLIKAIHLSSVKEGIGGEIFQIATNKETTVNEIIELLSSCFLKKGIKSIRVEKKGYRLGDVQRNFSDTTKARRLLGWEATTDLALGIEKTVEWFFNLQNG